ncbi:hypothetical protein AC578_9089 [Pseudocercospora eumusae]|uniref:Uncharacterized protein n=1 Tax=Pseudocercospora eumusae TaxID=321146 RepID=A0A139GTY1_9PEZI|nr:hypothetical protein AC578_9089 [Pseudocercospora eumusae]
MALSAGHRVAHITELLEGILLQLLAMDTKSGTEAHRTTLLSQRTCKAFRDVILGSTRLKQGLFLLPPAAGFPSAHYYNPLFRSKIPGYYGRYIIETSYFSATHAWFFIFAPMSGGLRVEIKPIEGGLSTGKGVSESWRAMYAWNRNFDVREMIVDGEMVELPETALENPTMGELFDFAFAAK